MPRPKWHLAGWDVELSPHPAAPQGLTPGVGATLAAEVLSFTVDGPSPRLPARVPPARTDGLWRTTCFELFVKPVGDDGYIELNFSPSTAWAAYRFDGYRTGMRDFDFPAPDIRPTRHGLFVSFDLSALPPPPWRVGLSAVVEDLDGMKSFWALAHPAERPDFHADACFALEVPAPG